MSGSCVRKDFSEAVSWSLKGARQGDPKSEYNLSILYTFGHAEAGLEQSFEMELFSEM